jgi:hypothetical protein
VFLKPKSIVKKDIVVPILQGTSRETDNRVVHGGEGFGTSRLTTKPHFPIEPALAITAEKAWERTIDHVVLAPSHNSANSCNMDVKKIC